MGDRRVVMVTGASRGIGRAIALDLATRGHALVLTARSLDGGARFAGTTQHDEIAGIELSGSVEQTADDCRRSGVDVLAVPMDLTDETSVRAAARTARERFGVVDTVVSNAIYQGPGVNDRIAKLPIELARRVIEGDSIAPLVLLQELLPGLVASRRGVFVQLTSGAATLAPRSPAGEGGWGVAYAMAKGAVHRIAGVLHAEHAVDGLRAYSLNPGHVTTEVMRRRAERDGRPVTGRGPEDTVRATAWLLEGSPAATAMSGQEVVARDIARALDDAAD